jgi:hypothetical protein
VAAIAAVCLAAHSASAQNQIGVNFVANDNPGGGEQPPGGVQNGWVDSLAPTDTAGVYPQKNWNNLGRFGDSITLNDGNGVSSGVSIAWTSLGMWHCSGRTGFPPGPPFSDPNAKLMDGFLESTWGLLGVNGPIAPGTAVTNISNCAPIIFLSGLQQFIANKCGGSYSIVIYCNNDTASGRHSEYWIDAVSSPSSAIVVGAPITPPIFLNDNAQFNGTFTQVCPSATNDAAACSGNYIEFDGLTNDEILIVSQNISAAPSAVINGIQVIALGVILPPIVQPPWISPTNVIFLGSTGSTVTISFSTYGCGLSYQWQTDGGGGGSLTNIPGATNSSVVTTPTTAGTWNYDVVVTNSYGSLTSLLATVTVLPASPPILTTDIGGVTPDDPSVAYNTNVYGFMGGNVQFHAEFNAGTMPITNQWVLKLDSGGGYTNIAGATGWYWTVTNVQSSKAGNYELTATNAVGSSNSTAAHLTALADPAAPPSNGATNMYANCVMTNHPWAYWKFEETNDTFFSSMQAYDYSAHNYDATYGNSTDGSMATGCKDGGETLPDLGPVGTGTNSYGGFPANNMCAKMSANHTNGYLTVPPLNLYTNTVTFTMWIKPNAATLVPSTGLFMNRNGLDAAGIGFGTATNALGTPCLAYTWDTNSSATYGWNSGLYPVAGIWNFVACVITPSNTTMYLYYASSGGTNLYKAANSVANGPEAFNGGTTWLGSDNWNNGSTFNGWIDEVAIFTNSLGENQVQDLFLKALALQIWPSPPVFYLQPSNTAVFQGQTLQLTALAFGIPNPAYQWQYLNATWHNLATTTGRMTTNATMYWQNFTGAVTSVRAMAYNSCGTNYSDVATVTYYPAPPVPTNGLWTVNFAIRPTISDLYHGRGVLGTNMYWNALSGTFIDGVGPQFTNVPPSLLDDGATVSGINFGSFPIYLGWSGSVGTNNVLLDTFCSFVDFGAAFIFTSVPNGIYKLALYGIDGASANLGTIFTVNGVSQSVTNAQDIAFLPDNTVVYTNVMVTNGTLEVTMVSIPRGACPTWGCDGAFNGAQLQLIAYYGPNILSLTNSGKNMVLSYVGGQLLEATNMSGPWTTNLTATSPFTISPTGQMKFYRVYTNNIPQ